MQFILSTLNVKKQNNNIIYKIAYVNEYVYTCIINALNMRNGK